MFPHPDNVNVNVEISEKNMNYSTSAIDGYYGVLETK